ncbi:hypothetical protein E5K00_03020 [Hymenobacter aquaticus]|uniref:Lipocalin-like domain-containing protein n=1 Tax=Hymenobacter aquaticus TaxID=1867101 RepID=A0A4Z0Q546_9BACT|nr:hypothetical protein [Hymenobacter aquaticus]TGE24201.1 hypothetical protein E5K00_03020 [Hymenobacter aquaticus]
MFTLLFPTPRLLPLLLLCLTLLTACKKDAAAPEPPLEGRWMITQFYSKEYDTAGTLLSEKVSPPGPNPPLMVITPNTVYYINTVTGNVIDPVEQYTREQNKLRLHGTPEREAHIVELTAHKLVLSYPRVFVTSAGYRDGTNTYTR